MITQLTPDMHGKMISCKIDKVEIKEAMIVYTKRDGTMQYHIAQNSKSGYVPDDKTTLKPFECSWNVLSGRSRDLAINFVSNIQLLKLKIISPEIY